MHGIVALTLPSLHVQPSPPLNTMRQAIMNFFGQAIAAAVFALTLHGIRNPDLRLAVEAGGDCDRAKVFDSSSGAG